jgi:N-acetylmuramoyl-L-alanine amidase
VFIDETLTAKGFTPFAKVPQVYGGPRIIDGIIIHHWGAFGQTHAGVVNFFVNGPGQTSAHFVSSGSGGSTCLVSPVDAAWHAGNGEGNRTKIGIELRPEASEADYREAASLIAWLRREYNHPLPLSPHRQWQATACPGVWDLAKLDAMAKAVTAKGEIDLAPQGEIVPTPHTTITEEDEMTVITLIDDGSGKIWATSDFITKWHVPDPNWIQHYLNIEGFGWIKLRRDEDGHHILKIPAFGAEVKPPEVKK